MTLETYSGAQQLGTQDADDIVFDFSDEVVSPVTISTVSVWRDPDEDLTLGTASISGANVTVRASTPLKSKAYEVWCKATLSDGRVITLRPILVGGQEREPPA